MQHLLTITCSDRAGIVAAVSGGITASGGFIEELSQYGDPETGRFFMRVLLSVDAADSHAATVQASIATIATEFAMSWHIRPCDEPMRVLLMVSKFDHCLRDLIYRHQMGALNARFTGIVSNHETARPIAEQAGIPFHHIPVTQATKPEAEAALSKIITETGSELIVLARYMQVLSSAFCAEFPSRIINIHHSFLPSFKGARPYHQAHERGVKLIGATAHYVTDDLDEGPIIEQSVERVHHSMSAKELVAIGRDVEAITLARAVRLHVEERVFLNGHRTVIFDR